MLNVMNENEIAEFCMKRHETFREKSCNGCIYRRGKRLSVGDDRTCIFSPEPISQLGCEKYIEAKEMHNKLFSKTKSLRNEKVFDLYAQGHTKAEISREIGISYQLVRHILRRSEALAEYKEKHWEIYKAAILLKHDEGAATKIIKKLYATRVDPSDKKSDRLIDHYLQFDPDILVRKVPGFGPVTKEILELSAKLKNG